MMEFASMFSTAESPEGIVGTVNDSLRIISIEKFGELLNQTDIPLRYSPRKMAIHPESQNLVIIESDNRAFSEKEKS